MLNGQLLVAARIEIAVSFNRDGSAHNIASDPVNDEKNNDIYNKYKELSEQISNIHFGGRLAEYKYYDMHKVIESALQFMKNIHIESSK